MTLTRAIPVTRPSYLGIMLAIAFLSLAWGAICFFSGAQVQVILDREDVRSYAERPIDVEVAGDLSVVVTCAHDWVDRARVNCYAYHTPVFRTSATRSAGANTVNYSGYYTASGAQNNYSFDLNLTGNVGIGDASSDAHTTTGTSNTIPKWTP